MEINHYYFISRKNALLSRNYEFYLVIMNYWPYGLPYPLTTVSNL